jgi:transcriptional regulator with XRE-family HTH domain
VSDIEQGTRNPSLVNIVQLAKALEITVAKLFQEYGLEQD